MAHSDSYYVSLSILLLDDCKWMVVMLELSQPLGWPFTLAQWFISIDTLESNHDSN